MKRHLKVFMLLGLTLFLLTACKSEDVVELKIPREYFDETVLEEEFQDGINSMEIRGEEVYIEMDGKKHLALMDELKLAIADEFDRLLYDEDCSYIRDVKYDEDFKNIDIFVDSIGYFETIDWTPMLISLLSETYQCYGGIEKRLNIRYIDYKNGVLLEEVDCF